jgi:hypothetical protein
MWPLRTHIYGAAARVIRIGPMYGVKQQLSLLTCAWTSGVDSYLLQAIARTAPWALSLNFSSMGYWEPVVEFEPTTRCLAGSGSTWVTCPPMCAGVQKRRCFLVLVPSVVLEWSPVIHGVRLFWLSTSKKGQSSHED